MRLGSYIIYSFLDESICVCDNGYYILVVILFFKCYWFGVLEVFFFANIFVSFFVIYVLCVVVIVFCWSGCFWGRWGRGVVIWLCFVGF